MAHDVVCVCVCVCVCVYALSSHFLFNTMHLRTGHYVPLQVIGLSLSHTHTHQLPCSSCINPRCGAQFRDRIGSTHPCNTQFDHATFKYGATTQNVFSNPQKNKTNSFFSKMALARKEID